MIKKQIFLLIIAMCFLSISETFSQNFNRKMTNNKSGEEILVGMCTRSAFMKDSYREWFIPEYKSYNVNSKKVVIDSLKPLINKVQIKIV
ncbi:MAG: hypothetical protein HOM80_13060, partial [Bacteroidetes bacterium]|nr:hypothetical protein [Bacteroidota bacterium]